MWIFENNGNLKTFLQKQRLRFYQQHNFTSGKDENITEEKPEIQEEMVGINISDIKGEKRQKLSI